MGRALSKPSTSAKIKAQAKKREAARKARLSEQRAYEKQLAKVIKAEKAKADKELSTALKRAHGKGIYEPESYELTKWRRYKAKKIIKEYGELLDPSKFFFVPVPKKDRKETLNRAIALELSSIKSGDKKKPASKTGLFIAKDNYKTARLKKDKSGEISIIRSGKIKRGERAGKRYTSTMPIASLDELTNQENRLRKMGEKIKLKGNEALAFQIQENGHEGFSRSSFSNINLLMEYLERYQKSPAARINFLRHIEIVKTESAAKWLQMHPHPQKIKKIRMKMNVKGRNT